MNRISYFLFLTWILISCGAPKAAQTPTQPQPLSTAPADDGKIEVVFLHINDVYEISPLEGGKTGGMARVAAYYKKLKFRKPRYLLCARGDFRAPR